MECSLRYLGIHFDRTLTYKTQVESTKLRCKKGLSMFNMTVAHAFHCLVVFFVVSTVMCVIVFVERIIRLNNRLF